MPVILPGPFISLPELVAWFDFSDTSTLYTDTGKITSVSVDMDGIAAVENKVTGALDLEQSNVVRLPRWRSAFKNGLGVAQFSATATGPGFQSTDADWLDTIAGATPAYSQPNTLFIVARSTDVNGVWVPGGGSPFTYLCDASTSGGERHLVLVNDTGGSTIVTASNTLGGGSISSVSNAAVWFYLTVEFDGINSIMRYNGTQVASGDTGADDFRDVRIGGSNNVYTAPSLTGNTWIGEVAEFRLYMRSSE